MALFTGATSQQQVPQEDTVQATLTVAVKKHPRESSKIKRHKATCNVSSARKYIDRKRNAAWGWQDKVYAPRTKTSYNERKVHGCGYLKWQARKWSELAHKSYKLYVRLLDHEAAICYVFGPTYCAQALTVSACESGRSRSTHAQNGQYLGMFQMGSSERAKYGHGPTPLIQAMAAYHYFVDTGRDWSPWSCQP